MFDCSNYFCVPIPENRVPNTQSVALSSLISNSHVEMPAYLKRLPAITQQQYVSTVPEQKAVLDNFQLLQALCDCEDKSAAERPVLHSLRHFNFTAQHVRSTLTSFLSTKSAEVRTLLELQYPPTPDGSPAEVTDVMIMDFVGMIKQRQDAKADLTWQELLLFSIRTRRRIALLLANNHVIYSVETDSAVNDQNAVFIVTGPNSLEPVCPKDPTFANRLRWRTASEGGMGHLRSIKQEHVETPDEDTDIVISDNSPPAQQAPSQPPPRAVQGPLNLAQSTKEALLEYQFDQDDVDHMRVRVLQNQMMLNRTSMMQLVDQHQQQCTDQIAAIRAERDTAVQHANDRAVAAEQREEQTLQRHALLQLHCDFLTQKLLNIATSASEHVSSPEHNYLMWENRPPLPQVVINEALMRADEEINNRVETEVAKRLAAMLPRPPRPPTPHKRKAATGDTTAPKRSKAEAPATDSVQKDTPTESSTLGSVEITTTTEEDVTTPSNTFGVKCVHPDCNNEPFDDFETLSSHVNEVHNKWVCRCNRQLGSKSALTKHSKSCEVHIVCLVSLQTAPADSRAHKVTRQTEQGPSTQQHDDDDDFEDPDITRHREQTQSYPDTRELKTDRINVAYLSEIEVKDFTKEYIDDTFLVDKSTDQYRCPCGVTRYKREGMKDHLKQHTDAGLCHWCINDDIQKHYTYSRKAPRDLVRHIRDNNHHGVKNCNREWLDAVLTELNYRFKKHILVLDMDDRQAAVQQTYFSGGKKARCYVQQVIADIGLNTKGLVIPKGWVPPQYPALDDSTVTKVDKAAVLKLSKVDSPARKKAAAAAAQTADPAAPQSAPATVPSAEDPVTPTTPPAPAQPVVPAPDPAQPTPPTPATPAVPAPAQPAPLPSAPPTAVQPPAASGDAVVDSSLAQAGPAPPPAAATAPAASTTDPPTTTQDSTQSGCAAPQS